MSRNNVSRRTNLEFSSNQVWSLYGTIRNFEDYEDLIDELNNANGKTVIVLDISSPGGSVEVGNTIIRAINSTEGTVISRIIYPSASMAAVIALACHGMKMERGTSLMFHTYSWGIGGKSGDVKGAVDATHKSQSAMFDRYTIPFLTKSELKRLDKGEDIYIHADDEDLEKRVKRHFPIDMTR